MKDMDPKMPSLSGSILIAHPSLHDANFKQTVILISAHSEQQGALGVILNRPMGKTLGGLKEAFSYGVLADVPLFFGGPVNENELILTAWQPTDDPGLYRLYFGLSPERAIELKMGAGALEMRAFMGYSGWSSGQIEGELQDNAWAVGPLDSHTLEAKDLKSLWRKALHRVRPEWLLVADTPPDPTLN